MALSGSISTGVWTDPDYGNTWKVVLNWTATQNVENNTSTISWNLKSSTNSTYGYVVISELRVKFGDEQIYYRGTSSHTNGYNGTLLASGTKTITHGADGTKSFTASVEAGIYNWAINKSGSGTITLNTIPRASSITSANNITLGSACGITWTPASSNFKYKLTFSLGSWNTTTGFITPNTTSSYTYTGYTISGTTTANSTTIYAQLPNSATGTMTATLATYNSDGTQLGSSNSKTFTVTIPSDVKPIVGTITLTPQTYSYLIKGKNEVTISVTGCSGGTGSNIKSYTFSGPGISSTTAANSATSNIITNAGTLTYTVVVTDNRGRTNKKTQTITCYDYAAPYFKSFNAYRVESSTSTTANDSGTYVRCAHEVVYSSVNGTNDITVSIYYKKESGNLLSVNSATDSKNASGSKTIDSIANDSTYTIYAQVTDNYGGSSTSTQITVFSTSKTLNIRPDGKGIALGKMAETSNLLDVAWNLKVGGTIDTDKPEETMKNLTYKGTNVISSTASDTTTNWGAQGNLATVFYNSTEKINDQPSQYGFVLNLTNGPNASEVHQLWATQASGSLAHRGGNSSGWSGTWRTILDSSNYSSYIATPADYIVEEKVNNDFKYRKWNSGLSELWYYKYHGNMDLQTLMAENVYSSEEYNGITVTLPSGVFLADTIPMAQGNVYSNGYTCCQVCDATSEEFSYRIWSPYSTIITACRLSVYMTGVWK